MVNKNTETESREGAKRPVERLVMQCCANCAEWQGSTDSKEKAECIERDKFTYSNNTCFSFQPDLTRFCGICGAIAIESNNSAMECTANDGHGASQWDYEWHDYSA